MGAPALPLPPFVLALLSAIQPLVLLVGAAIAGSFAAPKLGLRSLVVERLGGRVPTDADLQPVLPLVLASVLFGLAVNMADQLTVPLWLPAHADWPRYEEEWSPTTLVFGLLYGGLTEEVLCRWGLMSAIAWLLWAATSRRKAVPAWMIAAAIGGSSLIFAAGHLPALSALIPLSAGPVIRTLIFNSVIGVWFGWIFWRWHLEAAMLCHAAVHVGFALYALALIAATA